MTAEVHFRCGGDITKFLIEFLKGQGFRRDWANRRSLHNNGLGVSVEPSYDIVTITSGERVPFPRTEVTLRGEPMSTLIDVGYKLEEYIRQHCGEDYTRQDTPEPCLRAS